MLLPLKLILQIKPIPRVAKLKALSFYRQYSSEEQKTFYRRQLPENLTSFNSIQGKEFFKRSLIEGYAESFFSLSGNFAYQQEPSFCALASLSIALNSLAIDPGKKWKGIWRWYSPEILDCVSVESIKNNGLTLDELFQVARCNGLTAELKRGNLISYNEFLEDVRVSASSSRSHIIINFARHGLNQTGEGHFSLIASLSDADEQILVLDTAAFKYPSYYVNTRQLFQAMIPKDPTTGLSRGYLIVSKQLSLSQEEGDPNLLPICKISISRKDIEKLLTLFNDIGEEMETTSLESPISRVLVELCKNENENHAFFTSFNVIGHDLAGSAAKSIELELELSRRLKALLQDISQHPLFAFIEKLLPSCQSNCDHDIHRKDTQGNHLATLFFLSMPEHFFNRFPKNASAFLTDMQSPKHLENLEFLRVEVSRMRTQWNEMLILNTHHHH